MIDQGMTITPVGVVRNQQREIIWTAGCRGTPWRARAMMEKASREAVSRIEVDPGLDGILEGIEDFSHLLILWWPNQNPPEQGRLVRRVRPMGRQDLPLVGVFATRSPVRPNAILVTVVKLVKRCGNVLEVTGLDALDGSPVLDIKPMVPSDCPGEELRVPEWLQRVNREYAALGEQTASAAEDDEYGVDADATRLR